MAKGNIKAKLIDEKGVKINGWVAVSKGSNSWKKKTAGGTFKFKNLATGTYTIVAYTANKAAVSAVKSTPVKAGKTVTVTLILKKTGGTIKAGCPPCPPCQSKISGIGALRGADVEGGPWMEVTEAEAQKLVDKHGGQQGDALVMVEAAESDLPLPYVELMASAQMFESPDGFKIILITDDAHLEYFFIKRGTAHIGLRVWQYGVIGAVGAGAGALVLRKHIGTPGAVVIGAGTTLVGAALVSAVLGKFHGAVVETVK